MHSIYSTFNRLYNSIIPSRVAREWQVLASDAQQISSLAACYKLTTQHVPSTTLCELADLLFSRGNSLHGGSRFMDVHCLLVVESPPTGYIMNCSLVKGSFTPYLTQLIKNDGSKVHSENPAEVRILKTGP